MPKRKLFNCYIGEGLLMRTEPLILEQTKMEELFNQARPDLGQEEARQVSALTRRILQCDSAETTLSAESYSICGSPRLRLAVTRPSINIRWRIVGSQSRGDTICIRKVTQGGRHKEVSIRSFRSPANLSATHFPWSRRFFRILDHFITRGWLTKALKG